MLTDPIARALRESGLRIVVTGASGWLGMAALDILREALQARFESQVRCFGSAERDLVLLDGFRVRQRSLGTLGDLPNAPTLLFHLAFLTKDRVEGMTEGEYAAANETISRTVLGALGPIGVTGLFLASSGAASRADDPQASPAMRLYGQLKRADEERFQSWAEEAGASAAIARVFNLSGRYINKHERYALSSFIVEALAGRPIRIQATRPVVRGYVAIGDLIALSLSSLLEPARQVTRFETGGVPMELQDVAKAVADHFGGREVVRPAMSGELPDVYVGDQEAWQALLERHGLRETPFPDQVAETVDFLKRAG